jgi:hypothetical protein
VVHPASKLTPETGLGSQLPDFADIFSRMPAEVKTARKPWNIILYLFTKDDRHRAGNFLVVQPTEEETPSSIGDVQDQRSRKNS